MRGGLAWGAPDPAPVVPQAPRMGRMATVAINSQGGEVQQYVVRYSWAKAFELYHPMYRFAQARIVGWSVGHWIVAIRKSRRPPTPAQLARSGALLFISKIKNAHPTQHCNLARSSLLALYQMI